MWCLKKQKLNVSSSSAHYSSTMSHGLKRVYYTVFMKSKPLLDHNNTCHIPCIPYLHNDVCVHQFINHQNLFAKTLSILLNISTPNIHTVYVYACAGKMLPNYVYCTYILHTSIPYHHYKNNNQLQTMWLLINLLLIDFETEEKLPVIHCWLLQED